MLRRLAIAALAPLFAAALLAGCPLGDSVEEGCRSREDCPQPDRQICEVETGVCVGFTSPAGDTDGGDDPADADI